MRMLKDVLVRKLRAPTFLGVCMLECRSTTFACVRMSIPSLRVLLCCCASGLFKNNCKLKFPFFNSFLRLDLECDACAYMW